ncbi:GATA type zinc finger transcription factor family protein [Medicago truncatula]|uniref:GATA type zinc finger transcription factor family protein n=1 Tax=Medicago truncatula TaxID=3880 RepID=A0A072W151_MEDTR|nr:GATA type zinc finger transcription factor family protein [Medicago truncatula]
MIEFIISPASDATIAGIPSRPHYDQLCKRTGSLDKLKALKSLTNLILNEQNAKILANAFFLRQQKQCMCCKKTVYPTERVTVNGTLYHRGCFKCTYGGCTISSSNFVSHETKLYCKHHHIQLFKEIKWGTTVSLRMMFTLLHNVYCKKNIGSFG